MNFAGKYAFVGDEEEAEQDLPQQPFFGFGGLPPAPQAFGTNLTLEFALKLHFNSLFTCSRSTLHSVEAPEAQREHSECRPGFVGRRCCYRNW